MTNKQRSGFVAIIGRPNAGKSTFLNWILGEKLKLVSHKANATRKRSNAIVMHEDSQIIFIDTPGLHEREKKLNKFMLDEALKAMSDADVIVFLADVRDTTEHYEMFLSKMDKKIPHVLLISKIDMVSQDKVMACLTSYANAGYSYTELIPMSPTKNINKEAILKAISAVLPESPYFYDTEILTTDTVRDIYRDLIREAVFNGTSDEIPYETDVVITKIEESDRLDRVKATIIVNKPSQKLVVIGEGGKTIKRLGTTARHALETFSGKKIYLEMFVKVMKNWVTDEKSLKEIGYE